MTIEQTIQSLEREWDCDGFLHGVRQGAFEPAKGETFLAMLRTIRIEDHELIPKRLLSLLWYLPLFLEWQHERVESGSQRGAEYARFVTDVQNTMEEVLGVP